MIIKGQISLEYIIVVGFVTFAVIVLLGISLFYTHTVQDKIKVNQLSTFAEKIVSSAESVYYAGEPSKITVTAYLPSGVQNFNITFNSLNFAFVTSSGTSTIAFESKVPLLDSNSPLLSLNEGTRRLTITAGEDNVNVAEA
ncbi:hypothetical protein J4423_01475 [Candidatus Pacearchaeota archaeon]|nr:hypothetical protein [Candidatus Pacearchaeota archaeon]